MRAFTNDSPTRISRQLSSFVCCEKEGERRSWSNLTEKFYARALVEWQPRSRTGTAPMAGEPSCREPVAARLLTSTGGDGDLVGGACDFDVVARGSHFIARALQAHVVAH